MKGERWSMLVPSILASSKIKSMFKLTTEWNSPTFCPFCRRRPFSSLQWRDIKLRVERAWKHILREERWTWRRTCWSTYPGCYQIVADWDSSRAKVLLRSGVRDVIEDRREQVERVHFLLGFDSVACRHVQASRRSTKRWRREWGTWKPSSTRPCTSILPGEDVYAEFPIAPLPLYSVIDFSPSVQGSMFGFLDWQIWQIWTGSSMEKGVKNSEAYFCLFDFDQRRCIRYGWRWRWRSVTCTTSWVWSTRMSVVVSGWGSSLGRILVIILSYFVYDLSLNKRICCLRFFFF